MATELADGRIDLSGSSQTYRNIVRNAGHVRGIMTQDYNNADEYLVAMRDVEFGVWPEVSDEDIIDTWYEDRTDSSLIV